MVRYHKEQVIRTNMSKKNTTESEFAIIDGKLIETKKSNNVIKSDIDEVIYWIMMHTDNTEIMDKINKLTFQFTTQYAKYHQNRQQQ